MEQDNYRRKPQSLYQYLREVFLFQVQSKLDNRTEVFFLSFPKAGRSWMRVLLGKYLCERYQVPLKYLTQTYLLTKKAGVSRTMFSHGQLTRGNRPVQTQIEGFYRGKKVILLTRNIKDVMVSLYFQATKRLGKFQVGFSDFLWDYPSPVMNFIDFHNYWYENQSVPQDFLLVTYEETKDDPEKTLTRMLHFMGIQDVDPVIVKNAVEFASFESMRKRERQGKGRDHRYRPGDIEDEESYKTRKGIVGGYVDYLSAEDIELIDILAKRLGSPFVIY